MSIKIPVIDLFAGPGGLGEGFSQSGFEIVLSIEIDPIACQTLRLRKFYYLFKKNNIPNIYYEVIKGKKNIEDLKSLFPVHWKKANAAVLEIEINKNNQKIINNKITNALKEHKSTNLVILGGPPCQAYSLAGRSKRLGLGSSINSKLLEYGIAENLNTHNKLVHIDTKIKNTINKNELIKLYQLKFSIEKKIKEFYQDPKHSLYEYYLNIIKKFKPALFVMENVKGIRSANLPKNRDKDKKVLDIIISDIKNIGYNTCSINNDEQYLIKSEEYGIPQKRHRVIIIGTRSIALGPLKCLDKIQVQTTVHNMIKDMPKLRSGLSKEVDTYTNWLNVIERELKNKNMKNLGKYLYHIKNNNELSRGAPFIEKEVVNSNNLIKNWILDKKLNGVIQHTTRSHMSSDLIRYMFLTAYYKENKNIQAKLNDWPIDLKPNHKNIIEDQDTKKLKSNVHIDRFKIQPWESPSNTITSHISKDGHYYIHPDTLQCRSLTPREAARLQTFPENYFFFGGRTSQYHQIGNAVPPYLAYQIAKKLKMLLD
jgi:DNA (cytosine-5)-methyltransferase 1